MKKIALLLIVLVAISTQAQDNSAFKKETIEFIKLTGTTKAFTDVIDQIGTMVSQEHKTTYKNEATATLEGLYSKMAELYMSEFTEVEIKELVAFYQSNVGKKLATKQLPLMQKGMAIGQAWGGEIQAIAMKYKS